MSPQRDNNKDKDMAPGADRPELDKALDKTPDTVPETQAATPEAEPQPQTEPQAESATATLAAEPEPAVEAQAAAEAQPVAAVAPARGGISGGGAFVMGVLASVLVLGAVGAVAWSTLPQWQPQVAAMFAPQEQAKQVSALQTRIQDLEQTLATVRQSLPAAAGGTAVDAARVDALAQRLAALETQPRFDPAKLAAVQQGQETLAGDLAAVRGEMAGFTQAITEIKQDVTGFKQDLKQTSASLVEDIKRDWADFKENSVRPAQVLALAERVEAAEVAVQEARSRSLQAQAMLIATGQLREALYRGQSFAEELRALKLIAGKETEAGDAFATLEQLAPQGVASRGELASRFGELASAIIRADMAPEEPGWWRQTVQQLTSVVTVRRVDGEAAGDSVAAKVGRAEANLEKSDLAGAVRELSALDGAPAEVASGWLARAKNRLAAEQALSNLTAHAVAVAQAKG